MQGVGERMKTGTETMFPIQMKNIPTGRKITYAKVVVDIRPNKAETHRCRLTVGGDKIDYPYETATPTAAIETCKILFNSVISTKDSKLMTLDVKNFYLNTPMDRYEYIKIPRDMIPDEIYEQYNLHEYERNGHVYFEVRKGMYGLPQAGRLAHDRLVKHLTKHGYKPTKHTPGLWMSDDRKIAFALWVDDFAVKYGNRRDVEHLIKTMGILYEVSIDWSGEKFVGLTIKWDYQKRRVSISMPGYIESALLELQHPAPSRQQHCPHPYVKPVYGKATQMGPDPPPLHSEITDKENTRIQRVIGKLLYYARAVDPLMLPACNAIAVARTYGMKVTLDATIHLLDYATTYPNAILTYHASDMVLSIHSDASYLTAPKARSRAGGHHYLGNTPTIDGKPPANAKMNAPIHTLCLVMRNVMGSAAEAEVGALYENTQYAIQLRQALTDLGHKQPATPVETDNTTACDIIHDQIKQKRTRAMDMRFYWVRDRQQQGQFNIYWKPGKNNYADFSTKHHSPGHCKEWRYKYLTPPGEEVSNNVHRTYGLRGCIDNTSGANVNDVRSGIIIQKGQSAQSTIKSLRLAFRKVLTSARHNNIVPAHIRMTLL